MAKTFDPDRIPQPDLSKMKDVKLSQQATPPAGYIPIELSTKGLIGAPAVFHMRNFDTADLVGLALTDENRLPVIVSEMLDGLIWEKDVSVSTFHEKEVVETIVRLYQAFFSDILKDVEFPWNDDDIEALREKLGDTEEFRSQVLDLKNRKWIPRVDIALSSVNTYDVDATTLQKELFITDKRANFTAGFMFPRYGDILTIREFMKDAYRDPDQQFASLRSTLKFRQDAEERLLKGENIAMSRVPDVPDFEKDRYIQYESDKQKFGIQAIKALHLVYYEGQDVRNLSLAERTALVAKDPRIDYRMTSAVNKYFASWEIGLQPEIKMANPLKGVVEPRKYSFRLVDLLQAIKLYDATEHDYDFKSSHV